MRYAKAALLTGLLKLDPSDRFAVVAFDHDQQWWTGTLMGRRHVVSYLNSSPCSALSTPCHQQPGHTRATVTLLAT